MKLSYKPINHNYTSGCGHRFIFSVLSCGQHLLTCDVLIGRELMPGSTVMMRRWLAGIWQLRHIGHVCLEFDINHFRTHALWKSEEIYIFTVVWYFKIYFQYNLSNFYKIKKKWYISLVFFFFSFIKVPLLLMQMWMIEQLVWL